MRYLVCLAILSMCLTASADERRELVATGDHSVWVIANDVREMFSKDTGIKLELIPELAIVGKGCEKGISHVVKGNPSKDFGLICCALNEQTIANNNLKVYPFAKEPLAIIVNKKNPVKSLTLMQVREIFAGKIKNWSQVGGPNEKIVVLTQLHCKQHTANWKGIFDKEERFTKDRIDIKTQPEMAKTVAAYKQAIGHLEMTSVKESKEDIKILAVEGYLPTSENMRKGLYPLSATLSIVTKGDAPENVRKFVEFMRKDPKVKGVMGKYGMSQTD